MEKFNTLAEVRKRKELVRKDISSCENQILVSVARPLRFLGASPNDNIQKVKRIIGFASTVMSVCSLVRGFRKK